MSNEKKGMAEAEKVEAIREFLNEWYSVADLYKTAAVAGSLMVELMNIKQLSEEDIKVVSLLMNQHVMMTELMSNFEDYEEE